MASLFDVLDRLQELANNAVTPNGPTTLFGHYVDVKQGWPLATDVDKAMTTGRSLVSIYPVPSTTSDPGQIMNWDAQIIAPPVHGMTAIATASGFSLSGESGVGEYATVVIDGKQAFSAVASQGTLAEGVAADLAGQIGPRATWAGSSLTLTSISSLVVRIGAPAQMGEQLHRQRQQFRIVVWAPKPQDRAAVATAVDLAFKSNLKLILRDTSTALLTYGTTNLDDATINRGVYRADLLWSVLWDTYASYPAYEVTAVDLTLDDGQSAHVVQ